MSKYLGQSFNQLRTTAIAAGFVGKNPNRAALEAYLDSVTPPTELAEIKAPKVAESLDATTDGGKRVSMKKATKVIVESTPSVGDDISVTKRNYTVVGKSAVASRRSLIAEAAKNYFASSPGAVNQAKVFAAVCEATGTAQTATSWNDLSVALNSLVMQGLVSSEKSGDKKRSQWIAL